MKKFLFLIATALMSAACNSSTSMSEDSIMMFTGSYAPADSAGIKCYRLNQQSGEWIFVSEAAGVSNPSFVIVNPADHKLYAVGEDAGQTSTMNVLAYDADGTNLHVIDSKPTDGGAPCHITLSPDGKNVLTANYLGGSISRRGVDSDGILENDLNVLQFDGHGQDTIRQAQPHLHHLSFIPSSGTMLANDLGSDKIYVIPAPYDSVQSEINIAPGSGPRHTAFNQAGTRAYLLTELSGEVLVFEVDADNLTLKQTILADTLHACGSGDIHISPDDRFVYASTRLEGDGVVIFKVSEADGTLTRVGFRPTGKHPRNFAITPNGKFLLVACRDDDAIEIYKRDAATGSLILCDKIKTPRPTCIAFEE